MDEKIAASDLEFKVSLTPSQMVFADGAKLYRVFQNLIDNALKYAMPASRVYIDIAPQQGWTVARVRNVSARALDIPPEELTERFVRGDASRTDGRQRPRPLDRKDLHRGLRRALRAAV